MREQVTRARAVQAKRFGDGTTNARMDSRQLKQFCDLRDSCLLLMKQAMDEMGLSARAYDKVRRVARTIADIDGSASRCRSCTSPRRCSTGCWTGSFERVGRRKK